MGSRFVMWLSAAALVATALTPAFARGVRVMGGHHHGYSIVILNGLSSGGRSFSNGITDRGWISGLSDVSNTASHATVWQHSRTPTDLGTLGGPDSAIAWPNKSERGLFAGQSDTANTDPNNEDFCGNGTGDICLGFLWSRGTMIALPTLGGNNAQATSVNDRGEVVGFAETATPDPSCVAPQLYDWVAFTWDKSHGIQALPLVSGDIVSAAVMLNARGDAVGGSGPACGPVSSTLSLHAILWHKGSVVSLPTLGGMQNNVAATINGSGEMAGFSDLPGDTMEHAVLWSKHGKLKDAGTLPGDSSASFYGLNDRGEAVGSSCASGSTSCRAVLYDDGTLYDFNSLASVTGYYFANAADINDEGVITGQAVNMSTGLTVAFVAIPSDRATTHVTPVPRFTVSENPRRQLQRRAFHQFIRPF